MKNILLIISMIIIVSIIAVGVAIFIYVRNTVYEGKEAHLSISNNSEGKVADVRVALGNEVCEIPELKNKESEKCIYTNLGDSSYSITLMMESGAKVERKNMGYITNGFSWNDSMVIEKTGDIVFNQSTVNDTHNNAN